MSSLGLPVPPGFTITTEVCTYYYDHDRTYPSELTEQVQAALAHIAALTGRNLAMPKSRFWFRCAPVPVLPCPA